jgi:tripartite-type tricarboxylate transporter receptor subunit TctC
LKLFVIASRQHQGGKFPMRKLLIAAALTLAGMTSAPAQNFPTRPVTAIVPASAGGPTDTIARIVMGRAQQLLGQSIIIENVGGASGTIGTGRLVRAEADGYTI